jgi:hypothetical protein
LAAGDQQIYSVKMSVAKPHDRTQQIAADAMKAIESMNQARIRDNLDAWKMWGQKIAGLTPDQRDELQDAYLRNSDRIAGARQPTCGRVSADVKDASKSY